MTESKDRNLVDLTTEVVVSFVRHNMIQANGLADLIFSVHNAFANLDLRAARHVAGEKAAAPAVPLKKSINPDFLVCLEDGGQFKSLKRHLSSKYKMTPDDYRKKWGLPENYPMVAPSYSLLRSSLAKASHLGKVSPRRHRKSRKIAEAA